MGGCAGLLHLMTPEALQDVGSHPSLLYPYPELAGLSAWAYRSRFPEADGSTTCTQSALVRQPDLRYAWFLQLGLKRRLALIVVLVQGGDPLPFATVAIPQFHHAATAHRQLL